MFVLNGIVYANEKSENIQVVSVKPLDDMMMILTFSTGEQRLFDASILTGSAYKPLSDEDTFKNCKVVDPLFVTAIEPDKPAVQVVVDPEKIKAEIESVQHNLCDETDIVNGYVISDKTPRLHGRSVYSYWNNLIIGLGHTTKASVYGNFSINMKGLLKRMLGNAFASFAKFDDNCAVKFTADNLDDDVLMDVLKTLFGKSAFFLILLYVKHYFPLE